MKSLLWLACGGLLAVSLSVSGVEGDAQSLISGRVVNGDGIAIEQAQVSCDGSSQTVVTDARGEFELRCPLPCVLQVAEARFVAIQFEVTAPSELPVTISLLPKQAVFEALDVTAGRGDSIHFAPQSVASTRIETAEKVSSPSSLTEIVEGVAGVAENGQGGLFQVFSIRGVSRHRVLTLVDGIPMTSERRAGVSTSFIDPLLIDTAEVLRGPASTYYGSGALGGVVQVFPRAFDDWQVEGGYSGFGDERFLRLGYGSDGTGPEDAGSSTGNASWSVALAHRQMDDDRVADGTLINSHFEQTSAVLRRDWQGGGLDWSFLAIPTLGTDIGKPNTDFPQRVTEYPREEHLLLRLAAASPKGWELSAYLHPNSLTTDVVRVGQSVSTVENESFELGASWLQPWTLKLAGKSLSGRVGVDYFARQGVEARETVRRLDLATAEPPEIVENLSLDGRQNELAAFSSLRWNWGASTWQGGARFSWQEQGNTGSETATDGAWSAFLGVSKPLGRGFELTANLGTGLRFATLSERFFTGTTGRGQVIGNPSLDPERGLNADFGMRWYGKTTFLSVQVFQLDIDDYIERIDLDDGRRTFVNLNSGTIEGLEIEGFVQLSEALNINWSGHLLSGEDDVGQGLADVPSDRLQVAVTYATGPWQGRLQLQLRGAKDDPGDGEIPLDDAQLLSASVRYRFGNGLALTLRGRNLLDQEYRNSADDKVTLAAGRTVGLSFSWSPG